MSLESDRAAVLAAFPNAHHHVKTSTGGSKIISHAILSGVEEDLPVGPLAFTEEKAWRYAAERLELEVNGRNN
jgi:hypothetical protein